MKKTNSIIEEALIEASQLEEAVKEVGKEVLASAMKQEIEEIVKSSLTEEEEDDSDEFDEQDNEQYLFNFGFSCRIFQGWIRIFNISVFQLPHFFFESLEQSLPTVGIAKSPLSIGK